MTTTPIIEIPVDTSAFDKFSAAFEDYHDKLKAMPAAWQATNDRIMELVKVQQRLGRSTDDAWKTAVAASAAYEKSVSNAAKAQSGLASVTHSTSAAMARMAASGKALAGHLFGAVRYAAKLATFGIGGGLIGGGGLLFGLDRLADNVLTTQRSARGLGLTPGQFNSFRVNMARYAGTSVLAGAAAAQVDPTKWGQLATLGISPTVAAHESATALAGQEVMAAHRAWRQNPSMLNPAVQAAMQLGFSAGDVRNVGAAHAANLRAAISATHGDAGALGFSASTAREWSNFSIQLHKAGVVIETALVNTLAPLTPKLTLLSKEVASFITGLSQSKDVKVWIGDLKSGLQDFADWLKSPAFRADMQTMIWYFDKMAHAVGATARFVFGAPKPAPGVNNPLNMKDIHGKWMGFGSQKEGVFQAYERLGRYPAEGHGKTVAQEIATWNGHGPNTPQYQHNVAQWTAQALHMPGPFDLSQSWGSLTDVQRAAIISSMSRQEGHYVPPDTALRDIREKRLDQLNAIAGAAGGPAYLPPEHMPAAPKAVPDPAVSKLLQRINKRWSGQRQSIVIRNQTSARVVMSANAASP